MYSEIVEVCQNYIFLQLLSALCENDMFEMGTGVQVQYIRNRCFPAASSLLLCNYWLPVWGTSAIDKKCHINKDYFASQSQYYYFYVVESSYSTLCSLCAFM